MPTQTTYQEAPNPAYVGQVATSVPFTIISRTCEVAAGIGFGLVVIQGTADRGAVLPAGAGDDAYVGITCRDPSAPLYAADQTDEYTEDHEMRVMTKGEVWVTAGANVSAGDPVYFAEADGALKGAAAADHTQIANAVWATTTASGNIGKIRLG